MLKEFKVNSANSNILFVSEKPVLSHCMFVESGITIKTIRFGSQKCNL